MADCKKLIFYTCPCGEHDISGPPHLKKKTKEISLVYYYRNFVNKGFLEILFFQEKTTIFQKF